jgi:hypothetical protein
LAIARKHRAQLTGDNASYSAKSVASQASSSGQSAFGAATSSAANAAAQATDYASLKADDAFNAAIGKWSEVRVSTTGGLQELLLIVRSLVSRLTLIHGAFQFHSQARKTSF